MRVSGFFQLFTHDAPVELGGRGPKMLKGKASQWNQRPAPVVVVLVLVLVVSFACLPISVQAAAQGNAMQRQERQHVVEL